ncbi:MAG: GNAT family N-acetyltransferase [Thermoanaerobaculia bacterium]|nr:GNAT family N-acetyltransferase [Thermoanaerobaculia bacterium]
MNDFHSRLEENELLFLRGHRSAVYDLGFGSLYISSDAKPLTWNFAGALRAGADSQDSTIDRTVAFFTDWNRTPCLKVTPASEPEGWEAALTRRGWAPRVRLNHMVLNRVESTTNPDVHVRLCSTDEDLRAFSRTQCEGFGVPEWIEWVHKINVINSRRDDQRFYIAELESRFVGVSLLVSAHRVGGLYAVATDPEARGRGVARALIACAAADSGKLGNEILCLNTVAGGAAETVFRGAGFVDVFESRFYVPAQ